MCGDNTFGVLADRFDHRDLNPFPGGLKNFSTGG
jgi:hypothetical protein